jgi:hypothetical protein
MLRALWNRLVHSRSLSPRPRLVSRQPRRQWDSRLSLEILEDRLALSTFLVTNSTDNLMPGSLRYAITQANLPGNDGSIVRITNQVAGPIVLTEGELPINASLTIENRSGAPVEIRQDTADARVFHVAGRRALSVAVTGLTGAVTIDGGSVHDNGGGFLVDNPLNTLTLTDVEVVGNSAADGLEGGGNGGGIYSRGAVVLRGSVVGTTDAPNRATQLAGGVWADRGLTLVASNVDGNRAGADGGGVVVGHGNVTLTDVSSVSYNQAPDGSGGGINVQAGSVVVRGGSHVDGNSAFNEGGIRVGGVELGGSDAVRVVGGSTVNGNSSTALVNPRRGDFGGGGIAVESTGNVYVSASQVSDNHTVGMYSGGIVVGLGSVTITDGSQITGNTNRGPGGGIAANFGGTVTVRGGSQVSGNTGAAIGGGIVNFSGPLGSVTVTGGSQVDNNILTNEETIGRAIAVFLEYIRAHPSLGPAADAAARAARAAEERLTNPFLLVGGGGIGTLAAPISVTGGSEVNGNVCGRRDRSVQTTGLGGGVFSVLGPVAVDHSAVEGNQAPYGDGGGIYHLFNVLTLDHATISGNSAAGDGGGIWNGGRLRADHARIRNNTAGGDGGGLFNADGGRARIVDSAFIGNSAGHTGGGIANAGHLRLIDTVFADNTPDDVSQV